MQVETTRFGRLAVAEHQILTFAGGLFGFDDCFRFTLLEKGTSPLRWLQSLDYPELAFLVIDPRLPFADYLPAVTTRELAQLGLSRVEDAALLGIVSLPPQPRDMTVNLQAPILINPDTMQARQVISTDPEHSLRQPLFPALSTPRERKTG